MIRQPRLPLCNAIAQQTSCFAFLFRLSDILKPFYVDWSITLKPHFTETSVHLALSISACSPLCVCETVVAQPETPEICNIDISAIDKARDFRGGPLAQ